MSESDSKTKWLQELSDSETLWVMLSSKNPEDIRLAAGIIANVDADTAQALPVNELVMKLLEQISALSERQVNLGPIERDQFKVAISAIQDAIIELSKRTWIDPVSLLAQTYLSKRIAELAVETAHEDVINQAL